MQITVYVLSVAQKDTTVQESNYILFSSDGFIHTFINISRLLNKSFENLIFFKNNASVFK